MFKNHWHVFRSGLLKSKLSIDRLIYGHNFAVSGDDSLPFTLVSIVFLCNALGEPSLVFCTTGIDCLCNVGNQCALRRRGSHAFVCLFVWQISFTEQDKTYILSVDSTACNVTPTLWLLRQVQCRMNFISNVTFDCFTLLFVIVCFFCNTNGIVPLVSSQTQRHTKKSLIKNSYFSFTANEET